MTKHHSLLIGLCVLVIGLLEALALSHGINGVMLKTSFVLIGGIAGWTIKTVHVHKKRNG